MEIEEIVKKLIDAKDHYYNDEPVIPDEEFDALEDELRTRDPNNLYFSMVGSEIIQISDKPKMQHEIPMLSLDKSKTVKGVSKWIQKMGIQRRELIIEPKIDGISSSILYENGKLNMIATRGDGIIGQNISHIARWIKTIPKIIALPDVEVRGELYLPQDTPFPNPEEKPLRNLCGGLINREDHGLKDLVFVKFVAYQLLGTTPNYESENLKSLLNNKFEIVHYKLTSVENDIVEYYDWYLKNLRSEWEYETDGLVLVVNDRSEWNELDSRYIVRHHHFYNLALKAPSISKETILEDIEWSVSRLGRIIPVAIVRPVVIGRRIVTRASLSNYEGVVRLNLDKGDEVLIEMANDVIPYLVKNITKNITQRKESSI